MRDETMKKITAILIDADLFPEKHITVKFERVWNSDEPFYFDLKLYNPTPASLRRCQRAQLALLKRGEARR